MIGPISQEVYHALPNKHTNWECVIFLGLHLIFKICVHVPAAIALIALIHGALLPCTVTMPAI